MKASTLTDIHFQSCKTDRNDARGYLRQEKRANLKRKQNTVSENVKM